MESKHWILSTMKYGFYAWIAVSFVATVYFYGMPLVHHGYDEGMNRLLWGCDDGIRLFCKALGMSYDEANILLFVFLNPLMTLLGCIGIKLKSEVAKNLIFYGILTVGLVVLWLCTYFYLLGYSTHYLGKPMLWFHF